MLHTPCGATPNRCPVCFQHYTLKGVPTYAQHDINQVETSRSQVHVSMYAHKSYKQTTEVVHWRWHEPASTYDEGCCGVICCQLVGGMQVKHVWGGMA